MLKLHNHLTHGSYTLCDLERACPLCIAAVWTGLLIQIFHVGDAADLIKPLCWVWFASSVGPGGLGAIDATCSILCALLDRRARSQRRRSIPRSGSFKTGRVLHGLFFQRQRL